jgi:hypothetical protein
VAGSNTNFALSRRRFLVGGACTAAGLGIYSGEIERHWIDVTYHDVHLPGLSSAFEGMRIVQLSDIHLDEFTEAFFLRDAVHRINQLNPDIVFLTGDFISWTPISRRLFKNSIWECANILNGLNCRERYAILGNHDAMAGEERVIEALTDNKMTVLDNAYLPIERAGARFWLAGLDDPLEGHPKPDLALPASIRNQPNEPIVLLCHAPDYVDELLAVPEGQSVAWMLSGHTHGGQIRPPFLPPMHLPPLGQKYVDGWFHFGNLQLYVNRGIGTVGAPLRFNCRPEITVFTLRAATPVKSA